MMSPREAFQWLCAKGGPKDELDNYRFMVPLTRYQQGHCQSHCCETCNVGTS